MRRLMTLAPQASDDSFARSTFAPQSSTPTLSPGARPVAPADERGERRRAAGLGGDAQSRHSNRCAATIASSGTSAT